VTATSRNLAARTALACVLLSWLLLAVRIYLGEILVIDSPLDSAYVALLVGAPIFATAGLIAVRWQGELELAFGALAGSLLLPASYLLLFILTSALFGVEVGDD
jgi:hypothetical protein